MKKIALFDLCYTLYHSNTTFDFVRFYIQKKNIFQRIAFWGKFYFFEGLHKYDKQRKFLVSQLQGENKNSLSLLLNEFYEKFLSKQENVEVIEKLNYYRNNNEFDVYIVSASLDVIAGFVANKFEVACFSTEVSVDNNGRLTGEIKNDVLDSGKKQQFLESLLQSGKYTGDESVCFSDSIKDLQEWKAIKHRFFIAKDRTIEPYLQEK